MRVLVLGSGGREHAICATLAHELGAGHLVCAPGNAGIESTITCLPIDAADPIAVHALIEREGIGFTVVGPELPLTRGLVNRLEAAGHLVCGATSGAAEIESSKTFAKTLMATHRIPTARHMVVDSAEAARSVLRGRAFGYPVVLKADGLAAGKGVVVAESPADADAAIHDMMVERRFGAAGTRMVIEEFMDGREASFFVLTDGERVRLLPSAEDHKRIFDGDRGPNTGGMGAFSPSPLIDSGMTGRVLNEIVFPTLRAMRVEGRPYRGFLYCGLMITATGPRVVEFNARLGDPETQVVLPALDEPLLPHLLAAASGQIESGVFRARPDRFVGVVIASRGYPDGVDTGRIITGLDEAASRPGVSVFHAGTALRDGRIVTAGGRVLTVVARGADFVQARTRAYNAAACVSFDGMQYRRDIGSRAERE